MSLEGERPCCVKLRNQPDGREGCYYCDAPMTPADTAPVKSPKATVRACMGCGNNLAEGDKFCKYCGTACETEPMIKAEENVSGLFLRLCPNCGTEIEDDDLYCACCGRAVEKATEKKPSSGKARRVLGIVAALITVVLTTILIVRLVTNNPEAVAKNHIQAAFD